MCRLADIAAIAATAGPGLIGSLLVGLSLGRAMAWSRRLPFFAVHHLEGHLYSPWLTTDGSPAAPFPERFIGLVVSGGHTSLYRVAPDDAVPVTRLAETRDDAFGEAFDKFGKRLGLPYPQGPLLDQLAERGDAAAAPIARLVGTEELFFSYSGLKTQAVIRALKNSRRPACGCRRRKAAHRRSSTRPRSTRFPSRCSISQPASGSPRCARFSIGSPVCTGASRSRELAVSGGAAANRLLRRRLPEWAAERGVTLRLVPLVYSGDNAAMIAFAAVARLARGAVDDPLVAEAASRLPLGA